MFRGWLLGKRGDFFRRGGGAVFTKRKSTKKVYKQKCFSVTIQNLNCEILSKNLVTLDGVMDEKSLGFTKNPTFRGRFTKNQCIGGELPKKGGFFLQGG